MSKDTQKNIRLEAINTTNCPFLSKDYVIQPSIWVRVYGQAGITVLCSVDGDAIILDQEGVPVEENPYRLTLENDGNGYFRVAAPTSLKLIGRKGPSEKTLVQAFCREENDPTNHADPLQLEFVDYLYGGEVVRAYQYTTGAAAGSTLKGMMPCTVYAIVDRHPPGGIETKYLNVTLDLEFPSSAKLQGVPNPKTHNYLVNDDGSVEAQIVDLTGEPVSVVLGLPDSSAEPPPPFEVRFVRFP